MYNKDQDRLHESKMLKGTSKNSNFFVSARPLLDILVFAAFAHPCASGRRAHDCMDAGGRAKQEARAENRSVYGIHEDSSTELTPLPLYTNRKWHIAPLHIYDEWHIKSPKKCIFRGALRAQNA